MKHYVKSSDLKAELNRIITDSEQYRGGARARTKRAKRANASILVAKHLLETFNLK